MLFINPGWFPNCTRTYILQYRHSSSTRKNEFEFLKQGKTTLKVNIALKSYFQGCYNLTLLLKKSRNLKESLHELQTRGNASDFWCTFGERSHPFLEFRVPPYSFIVLDSLFRIIYLHYQRSSLVNNYHNLKPKITGF